MSWPRYHGEDYVDFAYVEEFCRALAEEHPEWVDLREEGRSHHGRPLLVLTLGSQTLRPGEPPRGKRPALWLDAGTHASEFTGISAVLFTITRWMEGLLAGDDALTEWFTRHDVVIMPCISPDGVQYVFEGGPRLRSSLSPPLPGQVRSGLDTCDVNGDGKIRMMRWKDPAGSFVGDEEWAPFLRPRRIDDDPEEAYFLAAEGEFINWDGVKWVRAPRAYGVDLNRNFPGQWEPFAMFGMHAGRYSLSEPESRAVVDAFATHPHIGCALTMHTYTGCILTQPYRKDTPLSKLDIELMESVATDLARDTGYDVFRVYPDFSYDPDRPIVGVWADTIATVFGVPGYTVECWNPFPYADLEIEKPLEFLMRPDPERLCKLLKAFARDEEDHAEWEPFDHPQLGPVEIGGIEYMRTLRNPPVHLLAEECEKLFLMCDRARHSLPRVTARVEVEPVGAAHRLRIILENQGFLSTSGLKHGEKVGAAPGVSVALELDDELLCAHPTSVSLPHLEGWGELRVDHSRHNVYAGLSTGGHRQFAEWTLQGAGEVTLRWQAGRAGTGQITVEIPHSDG